MLGVVEGMINALTDSLRHTNGSLATITRQEVFELVTNSDLNEGRGIPVSIGFCATQEDAKFVGLKLGVQGTPAQIKVSEGSVLDMNGQKYLLVPMKTLPPEVKLRRLRESGLAKLSDEEKEALRKGGW